MTPYPPVYKLEIIVLTRSPKGQVELFNGMRRLAGENEWKPQWYLRVRSRNGRILAISEGYNRKAAAKKCYVALLRFFNS